ncbi:MAG: chromophore lyase CpcT/CpeT [Erythrobacter cryptus]
MRYGLMAAGVLLAVALGARAQTPEAVAAPAPVDLARAMSGQFATLADDSANNFAETRLVFDNPALLATLAPGEVDGALVYSSLLTGPERRPYRRRVSVITRDGAGLRSEAYAFADPARFAAGLPSMAELAGLVPADLVRGIAAAPGADCAMRWRALAAPGHWRGMIDRADCRLWSERRGAFIALEAETRIEPGRIAQTERGYDADGHQLFGTAPGEFIVQVAVQPQP